VFVATCRTVAGADWGEAAASARLVVVVARMKVRRFIGEIVEDWMGGGNS